MAKPRVIIADTDINYILSLQLKFIEDFFEKIDLEIISDCDYFEKLFSSPQKADILIVSEDLYDMSLEKHNIGNVFLMTEQPEEEQTDALNITRIFKYTSIKEIFNEIQGKSASTLNVESNTKQEPQIIVVTSAAGGVGKTTVAMGISACLEKNYKKVLYINTDELPTFQYLMKNETPITNVEVYSKLMRSNISLYEEIKHSIRTEIFSYLPPFKTALMSMGIDSKIFKEIANAAKRSKEYDFIIIDTNSSFDEKKAELMTIADKVIIVTKQSSLAVNATNMLVSAIDGVESGKYLFVCNDFDKELFNALISPEITLKFVVNDYIEKFTDYDQMGKEKFVSSIGLQKNGNLDFIEVNDMETAIVNFINQSLDVVTEMEIPLNITANDLIYALNEVFHLNLNNEDIFDYYLVSENPIAFLKGNKQLKEYGIRHGSSIIFKRS